jgi:cyclase
MPVRVKANAVFWLNYHSKLEVPLSVELINELPLKWASELMLTDWAHEGVAGGFDQRIVEFFSLRKKPLIVFGGLSEASQLSDALSRFNVVAAGVGNFLSYKEHALQKIKQQLFGVPIRSAKYANEEYKY